MTIKDQFTTYIHQLQNTICAAIEKLDGKAVFVEDRWVREEGGGGITRIMTDGNVIEKGGVNTSIVSGNLPLAMQQAFNVAESDFFACGLSLVLHPLNPFVPTVHANYRYFELYDKSGNQLDSWFGGGSDLTPYYLFKEDGKHFHTTLKNAMDAFGTDLYPKYKQHCDEYFINKHRTNEARGIGGVFYDYLRPKDETDVEKLLQFQIAMGNSFLPAYLPIAEQRKDMSYSERERDWQEIRRGRYVEFNLIHDRGTLFGLKTNGRTESILMSLPPRARWMYNYTPEPGSKEAELQQYLKPQDWVNIPF
jgi:coproporphyrinogen III oxidase